MNVEIYTDGSGTVSGPMGWAFVVVVDGEIKREFSDNSCEGTNNLAELKAVISAFEYATDKGLPEVTIRSDSRYVVDAINQRWILKWARNKWKNARHRPTANREQWETLLRLLLTSQTELVIKHVKGHSGNPYNDRADELAGIKRRDLIARTVIFSTVL